MTESKVIWLAVGIIVGYVLWGDRRLIRPSPVPPSGDGGVITPGTPDYSQGGFPPNCNTCGGV